MNSAPSVIFTKGPKRMPRCARAMSRCRNPWMSGSTAISRNAQATSGTSISAASGPAVT